uniref:[histone H3]-lysine(4) N-trimethyltransferase n=1 Tax=Mustela putorius furo TaxID=9669 RepID=M3YLL3_MUSPF
CQTYAFVLIVKEKGNHERTASPGKGLTRCRTCEQAFYCNVECQKIGPGTSWNVVFGVNWNLSETRLTARILANQKIYPEKTPSEKLLAVKEFASHPDKSDNEKKDLIRSDIAALHHFDSDGFLVLSAQGNCSDLTVEDDTLSRLRSAVFPEIAPINQSCCPNIFVTYKGNPSGRKSVQGINPGEEVFVTYTDLLYPTEDRDSYIFTCPCQNCTKDKDKAKVEIQKLSPPKAETIYDMVRYVRDVIEEFQRAKHYKSPRELLKICELSQENMSSGFEHSNVYMLHVMYQATGICSYVWDWEGALRYGQKIKPYCKHFLLGPLNMASLCLKLGRLYRGLGTKAAQEKAQKAIAIMEGALAKIIPEFLKSNGKLKAL